jgi:signal transduction histidine kinase
VRRRIVILVVAVSGMVAIAFLVPLAFLIREFARDQALTDGERAAQAVVPVLSVTAAPRQVAAALEADADDTAALTVFLPNDRVVGDRVDADADVELARREPASFTAEADGGVAVLTSVRGPDGDIAVVRVLVSDRQLVDGVARSWLVLGLVGVALWVVAILVADRLGRSTVEPVRELAQAARRLGEGDLTVSVIPSGPPDVAQVGEAFNELVGRVRRLLAAERELVADLSHRLRTPLTALRLDAEGVEGPERSARLTADVDALERAVDDLIREARVGTPAGVCDLVAVVADRTAFWSALADEQGRRTDQDLPAGPLPVAVGVRDLEAAVDALLGNVFSHTPDGTSYTVRVGADDTHVELMVEDDGPGLDAESLERGSSTGGSTGLGLDIVARTAEAAGGRFAVGRSLSGGARFCLRIPAAPAETSTRTTSA